MWNAAATRVSLEYELYASSTICRVKPEFLDFLIWFNTFISTSSIQQIRVMSIPD